MARPVEYREIIEGRFEGGEARYGRAIEIAKDGLSGLVDEKVIEGAFLFGSATFGDTRPRSDLDALILLADTEISSLRQLSTISRKIYDETGVISELSSFSREQLLSNHPYRENIVAWLQSQSDMYPENIIGTNPVDLINPGKADLRSTYAGYLGTMRYSLQKEYLQGHHFKPEDTLSFVLNIPHVTGRRLVDILEWDGTISPGSLKDLKKDSIAETTLKVFDHTDPAMKEQYMAIKEDADRFDEFIDEVSTGRFTEEEFDQIIEATLEINLERAIEYLIGLEGVFKKLCVNFPRRVDIDTDRGFSRSSF